MSKQIIGKDIYKPIRTYKIKQVCDKIEASRINKIKKISTLIKIGLTIAGAATLSGLYATGKIQINPNEEALAKQGASIVETTKEPKTPPVVKIVQPYELFSRDEYYKKINEAKKREEQLRAAQAKKTADLKAKAKPMSSNNADWKAINTSCSAPTGQAKTDIINYIKSESKKAGISGDFMVEMARRESNWRWCAVGDFHVSQPSVGMYQINLRWNPSVSKQQALDWKFSVRWAVKEVALGKVSKWTTGRKMISQGWDWK